MTYDPIKQERDWYEQGTKPGGKIKPLPARHHYAHSVVRSKFGEALASLGCGNDSLILELGCGSGEDAPYSKDAAENAIGVDVSQPVLTRFNANGFQGVLADVKKLPFKDESFNYVVCSGLLHHLVGQGDMADYVKEFTRVARPGGYLVALEPNVFHPSGMLMNIFNTLKPGITGLVPHERALSPLWLSCVFRSAGLNDVNFIASSYVWNRLPLRMSQFLSTHEDAIRKKKPFSLFGWFTVVWGRK